MSSIGFRELLTSHKKGINITKPMIQRINMINILDIFNSVPPILSLHNIPGDLKL